MEENERFETYHSNWRILGINKLGGTNFPTLSPNAKNFSNWCGLGGAEGGGGLLPPPPPPPDELRKKIPHRGSIFIITQNGWALKMHKEQEERQSAQKFHGKNFDTKLKQLGVSGSGRVCH